MKLPAFDHKDQKWDQWKEFYNTHGGGLFTQFTTGELICTANFHTRSGWGHSSNERGEFHKLNLSVFQMNDSWNPTNEGKQFYDPKRGIVVKKTWMPQAVPLLWDRCVNRVVCVGWGNLKHNIPSRFESRCRVYWAGEGRNPVAAPITYHKLSEWTKEERREARERAVIIATQVRLGVVPPETYVVGGPVNIEDVLKHPIAEMRSTMKHRVAKFGLTTGYTQVEAEYLEVRNV